MYKIYYLEEIKAHLNQVQNENEAQSISRFSELSFPFNFQVSLEFYLQVSVFNLFLAFNFFINNYASVTL